MVAPTDFEIKQIYSFIRGGRYCTYNDIIVDSTLLNIKVTSIIDALNLLIDAKMVFQEKSDGVATVYHANSLQTLWFFFLQKKGITVELY